MDDREKLFYKTLIESWQEYIKDYFCVLLLWKGMKVDDVVEVTNLSREVVEAYQKSLRTSMGRIKHVADILGPNPSKVWHKASLLRYIRC